jgi:recombination associated protein RdgC
MWFKNLVVYRLGAGWSADLEALEEKLAQQPLQKCGGYQMESVGWVPPRHEGQYVYSQNRQWLLALGFEQKLLPASVIRQAADEKIADLEAALGHPVGRKQKREMRDKVEAELMPRALSRRRTTYAWIDTVEGWLAIDAAGEPRAEQFVQALGKADDTLTLARLDTQVSPSTAMTQWVLGGEIPGPLGIDQDLELRVPDASKATVRYVRHSLEGKDIRDHIAAGKQAVRLGMTWNDRISLVLTEQCHVKRLSFLEILQREGSDEVEDEDERFDLDFALMTGELPRLLKDLVKALGGEKPGEARAALRKLEQAA